MLDQNLIYWTHHALKNGITKMTSRCWAARKEFFFTWLFENFHGPDFILRKSLSWFEISRSEFFLMTGYLWGLHRRRKCCGWFENDKGGKRYLKILLEIKIVYLGILILFDVKWLCFLSLNSAAQLVCEPLHSPILVVILLTTCFQFLWS